MKVINGKKYYTAKEVGMLVNRTHLTVHLWDTWSNELAERGEARLIPEPLKVGKQGTRYWSEEDIEMIKKFANNIQRGDLAEFSKRQWSKKGKDNLPSLPKKKQVSDKKLLKSIDLKKELSIEEKIVYAILYFSLEKGKAVSLDILESYLKMEKNIIKKSLDKLIQCNYVAQKDNQYMAIV